MPPAMKYLKLSLVAAWAIRIPFSAVSAGDRATIDVLCSLFRPISPRTESEHFLANSDLEMQENPASKFDLDSCDISTKLENAVMPEGARMKAAKSGNNRESICLSVKMQ
jgi:hypothetical protein